MLTQFLPQLLALKRMWIPSMDGSNQKWTLPRLQRINLPFQFPLVVDWRWQEDVKADIKQSSGVNRPKSRRAVGGWVGTLVGRPRLHSESLHSSEILWPCSSVDTQAATLRKCNVDEIGVRHSQIRQSYKNDHSLFIELLNQYFYLIISLQNGLNCIYFCDCKAAGWVSVA